MLLASSILLDAVTFMLMTKNWGLSTEINFLVIRLHGLIGYDGLIMVKIMQAVIAWICVAPFYRLSLLTSAVILFGAFSNLLVLLYH